MEITLINFSSNVRFAAPSGYKIANKVILLYGGGGWFAVDRPSPLRWLLQSRLSEEITQTNSDARITISVIWTD